MKNGLLNCLINRSKSDKIQLWIHFTNVCTDLVRNNNNSLLHNSIWESINMRILWIHFNYIELDMMFSTRDVFSDFVLEFNDLLMKKISGKWFNWIEWFDEINRTFDVFIEKLLENLVIKLMEQSFHFYREQSFFFSKL